MFLSELRQISTNFYNFWQKDSKEVETECISHNLASLQSFWKKIIKIGGNLTKFWQKQFCTVFWDMEYYQSDDMKWKMAIVPGFAISCEMPFVSCCLLASLSHAWNENANTCCSLVGGRTARISRLHHSRHASFVENAHLYIQVSCYLSNSVHSGHNTVVTLIFWNAPEVTNLHNVYQPIGKHIYI